MRLALRYFLLSGIVFAAPSIFFSVTMAQVRCATVEYAKALHPDYELRRIRFEEWMTEKKIARADRQKRQKQATTFKIPVVVHVIHNGESIGTGSNISDAQILSQLSVLNQDFNRQNADAINTPALFAPVAASLDIEFVLAKQDPDGFPTNGIVRVDGDRNGWTALDNYALKSLSYWPAEQYLNIWVCNLVDTYVGFAQFPESDLPGHENSSTNRLTDGVVIWHRAFGSVDDGAFSLDPVFNKGRTATHEVGHFLGLMHIWGADTQCNGTDYVNDTPKQAYRTNGCPTHPTTDACGEVIMFQNFMDYTDDRCMNLFTQGQVERMTIVLENSPRRQSLLTSPGLEPPDPLPNDIGVRNIVFPDASVCSNDVTPVIELRNYGNNAVTSARVRLVLDGAVKETLDFALSLDPDESAQVSFSALSIPSGSHTIEFQVLLTNGVTDGGSYNDLQTSNVVVPAFGTVPFTETLNSQPPGWITQNFDGQVTWAIANAPTQQAGNKALKLNYFAYEDKVGEVDVFLSPVLDLTSAPAAVLTFDVAHARYQNSNDRLKVVVLTDCQDVFSGTTVYNKAGDTLKTAPPTTSPFTPANASQWRKELIDLSPYVGMPRVQIAFVGINDWGNNIYVDNITLSTEATRDLVLRRLASPSPVTCHAHLTPEIVVQNAGSVVIDQVLVEYYVNGGAVSSVTLNDLGLNFGIDRVITLPLIDLPENENTITVNVSPVGGIPDSDESNNEQTFVIAVNDSRDRVPLRENLESGFPGWTIINPSPAGGENWEVIPTNFGRSLYFNAFDNEVIGDESWFVSPVLDFSRAGEASVEFDLSYSQRSAQTADVLTILASTDCGNTFQEVSFEFPETGSSSQTWKPSREDEWRLNVKADLTELAGNPDARIAFVISNRHGNNLYLDNIEFFSTARTDLEIPTLYSIYGYDLESPEQSELFISFNLPERQDVQYTVVNMLGQAETDGIIIDALNQTFPLDLPARLAQGMYIIRLRIGGKFFSTRVLVP